MIWAMQIPICARDKWRARPMAATRVVKVTFLRSTFLLVSKQMEKTQVHHLEIITVNCQIN